MGFLSANNIEAKLADSAFFKPDNKPRFVLLKELRAGTSKDVRSGKNAKGEPFTVEPILVARVATEEAPTVEKRWEVTSGRLAAAIDRLPDDTRLPIWVKVQSHGKGTDMDYTVAVEAPPNRNQRLPETPAEVAGSKVRWS